MPGHGALGQVAQGFNVIIEGLTRSFNVLIGGDIGDWGLVRPLGGGLVDS